MKPKIIIAGGSGFLGQVLARHFSTEGLGVVVLTRRPRGADGLVQDVEWNGRNLGKWAGELEGSIAVINLTGRSVDCRYHARNRKEIMDSRVDSTRVIGQAIGQCKEPPRVWLNASTATIYKHTFGPAWDERGEIAATAEAKDKFSVEVACAWEKEFDKAVAPRTRKVALRTAMVVGRGRNSVFRVLRRLVRVGLGGRMSSGKQFVSWIHEADFCRALEWIIQRQDLSGVINICAPNPLPNAEMMRTLRELLGMPLGLPALQWMLEAGAFVLRTETELIIKSRRVFPQRLLDSGFNFHYSGFHEAAENLLQPSSSGVQGNERRDAFAETSLGR